MSLKELQESVLALPADDRSRFFQWVHQQEEYGDVDPEAVAEFVSEVWEAEENQSATGSKKR